MHGGATPRGKASSHYKHGKFSKFLPDKLAKRYEAAVADEELLDLRSDVGLMTVRLEEALSEIEAGTFPELWAELQDAMKVVKTAKTTPSLKAALSELDNIVTRGCKQSRAWDAVGRVVKDRVAAAQAEHRRLQELENFIDVNQAMNLLIRMYNTFLSCVPDKKIQARIGMKLQAVLGEDASEVLGDLPEGFKFDDSDIPETGSDSEPPSTPSTPDDSPSTTAPPITPNTPIETFSDGAGV